MGWLTILFLSMVLVLPTKEARAQGKVDKLALGYSISPPNMPVILPYVALEKGFFKNNGLDVTIKGFPSGSIAMQALIAKEVEAGFQSTEALVARGRGSDVRAILIDVPVTDYAFMVQKGIRSAKDLVGKRIAVSRPGAISWHIPRIFLKLHGVDPDKVEYVGIGSPASRLQALLSKKVDGAVLTTEHWLRAEKEGLNNLGLIPEVIPDLIQDWTVVDAKDLERKREKFYGYVKSELEASRFIRSHKEETIDVTLKWGPGTKREDASKAYDILVKTRVWQPYASLYEKSYDYTMKLLLEAGYLKKPIPMDDFYDRSLVKRAMAELGITPR